VSGFVREQRDDLFIPQVRRRFDLIGFDPRGLARSRPIECFETTEDAVAGPIIDHMSTANVAHDVDLLRRAVGDRRTTFVGYSYGSMVGSTYAAMFQGTCARWSSTASSTRCPGRPGVATRPSRCPSTRGCAANRARSRRCSSS